MENSQSKVIKTFGIILIIWGIAAFLLTGLNCLVYGAYSNYSKLPPSLVYVLLYEAILVCCGIGLKKQKKWARISTLLVAAPLFIIIMPYNQFKYLLPLYSKGYVDPKIFLATVFEIIRILFGVSLLYFFTRPKVKELFK